MEFGSDKHFDIFAVILDITIKNQIIFSPLIS